LAPPPEGFTEGTNAFHRDRGDNARDVKAIVSETREELVRNGRDSDAEYLYIFEDDTWKSCTIRNW
jgi:hypothetical protein